ncbi:hypothetical protein [Streptomyces sp. SID13031]|uniref:hypothetical protein n=1 Tax=Streptomyces sp. SID13031 TaxID=2706046 RepID=UPI0019454896|nr:hypothetical protein [Streptomyces sp. SID13031]
MALCEELLVLETATFEVEDISDLGQDALGWCSSSCACSSCTSCSTSGCCSSSTSTSSS